MRSVVAFCGGAAARFSEPLFCVGSPDRPISGVCLKCDCWGE